MHFPLGYGEKRWDVTPEIQERIELDGPFCFSKPCPGKQRKTQINGGCIEGVNGFIEFYPEIVVTVELSCDMDEDVGKISIDAPISFFICISQGAFGHCASYSHAVELGAHGP